MNIVKNNSHYFSGNEWNVTFHKYKITSSFLNIRDIPHESGRGMSKGGRRELRTQTFLLAADGDYMVE